MGWVIALVVVAVLVAAFWNVSRGVKATNAALGVDPSEIHRVAPLNYLGGHPDLPRAVRGCWLTVTPKEVAIEKGNDLVSRVPMADIVSLEVETEQEARQRLTATRMLAVGVFALAMPKKTPGSVLVILSTRTGPMVFEKERTTKPATLKLMGPALAVVHAELEGRPPEEPSVRQRASMADEIAKLAALRDAGELTHEEFSREKARLLSD